MFLYDSQIINNFKYFINYNKKLVLIKQMIPYLTFRLCSNLKNVLKYIKFHFKPQNFCYLRLEFQLNLCKSLK